MMTMNETVRRFAQTAATQTENEPLREVAQATGGLPVYMDMGGALVITEDLDVLAYEWETKRAEREVDEGWRRSAYCHAARRYPELQALLPVRPANARTCPQCSGTGLDCGTCWSTGWVE
jgi:hypothetical protein